jgi:hypothetical protein
MKRFFLLLVATMTVSVFSLSSFALEVTVDDTMAAAIYKEDERTISSDWHAFYNKSTIYLADYDGKSIEGEAFFGMFVTAEATESWDINSIEFQTNDMRFWGMDTGADIGWGFSFDMNDETTLCIVPMAGYRWKFIRFTRQNFNILNTITIRETVDEDFNLHFLDLGGRVSAKFGEKFEIFVKPIFGIALYNSAENSESGAIEGDGGLLFDMDAGFTYAMTENLILGFMFTCEIQRLNGGESGMWLWPDNSLDTYGGTISLTYRF